MVTPMADSFNPMKLPDLLRFTLRQVRAGSFYGYPDDLFFRPSTQDPFRFKRYGVLLDNPIGVAAGPHTQLAQNIISSWLYGARYLELKTIQTLDELQVAKPCIDLYDEGYNCEWSQELKVSASFREYFNAWIVIHILQHVLGFEGTSGMIFNMSVGYDFDGIMRENVQWFLDKMNDCSAELDEARLLLRTVCPEAEAVEIPSRISGSVTLSTMHGCPPSEIGKIARYLISERHLHTTIKLNPTLLGAADLRSVLNDRLHYATEIPDQVFDHDLKYPEALEIIDDLSRYADAHQVCFSVKLSNTLACLNKRKVFPSTEKMAYLSGRALHPVTVTLAGRLKEDRPDLDISFSGGVDCFNLPEVISCGLLPVTVCSDLLKPGGYGRLHQYIGRMRDAFEESSARNIPDYISTVAGKMGYSGDSPELFNLKHYATKVTGDRRFRKGIPAEPSIKTTRQLEWFDCIHAPCTDTCPAEQDIPGYLGQVAQGAFGEAYQTIFKTNPLPSVLGSICDNSCEYKCTRINYDDPLQIREIKKFVANLHHHPNSPGWEQTENPAVIPDRVIGQAPDSRMGIPKNIPDIPVWKAAVIGAGPAGLTCGWFLRQAGFEVDIFDRKRVPGGMISAVIPPFRLDQTSIDLDVLTILDSGIKLHCCENIDKRRFETILKEYDTVFLAAGAQLTVPLLIEGITSEGVLDPLRFLSDVKTGQSSWSGKRVVVIGGGNTAMDVARTAKKIVPEGGEVTLVYRRTMEEMPADRSEIAAARAEGINILELVTPERIISEGGAVKALVCSRNVLYQHGDPAVPIADLPSAMKKDPRPIPVKIPDSEFELLCDTIIPALGQKPDLDFVDRELLQTENGRYATRIENLYVGGDVMRGASTAIKAVADGRKAAEEIIRRFCRERSGTREPDEELGVKTKSGIQPDQYTDLMRKRAERSYRAVTEQPHQRDTDDATGNGILTEAEARREALRCLQCQDLCSICVTVCPNLANFCYRIEPAVFKLQKAVRSEDGSIRILKDNDFRIEQALQVLNIRDWCNGCGNCTTFCPSSGSPFTDKPGLCLSEASLNREHSGFLLSRSSLKEVLIFKDNGHIKTLTLTGNGYEYETDQVRAKLKFDPFELLEVTFLTPCTREARFIHAAQMSIVMQGAKQLPGLPDPSDIASRDQFRTS
ncbi:MAG: putative selenate reductase subunit YgfK [Alphaproteobacteria bacterium]|nr:putative selenate reductase subunit YgfK [Alphaproteobacteria bacterium]